MGSSSDIWTDQFWSIQTSLSYSLQTWYRECKSVLSVDTFCDMIVTDISVLSSFEVQSTSFNFLSEIQSAHRLREDHIICLQYREREYLI